MYCLQPSGATSADRALELAFKVSEADALVFVTDGAPTNPAGRPYPPDRYRELLDRVKKLNQKRKVTIHVIAISSGNTAFSSGLAEENKGQYLVVD